VEDQPAYHLDVHALREAPESQDPPTRALGRRRWIGVRFECCNVYARIYRNPEGTAYTGRCPHCLRRVRVCIGPDGTDCRFFTAG
jgi:hypothetical protein